METGGKPTGLVTSNSYNRGGGSKGLHDLNVSSILLAVSGPAATHSVKNARGEHPEKSSAVADFLLSEDELACSLLEERGGIASILLPAGITRLASKQTYLTAILVNYGSCIATTESMPIPWKETTRRTSNSTHPL